MFHYRAYGLGIASCFQIPELLEGSPSADIQVRNGDVGPVDGYRTPGGGCLKIDGLCVLLHYPHVGSYRVEAGNTITVAPVARADLALVRAFLLGPAMALLLQQRGLIVLHGSAVGIQGEGIAFIGAKGWGKSTVAAALHRRGHALLVDDVLAINGDGPNSDLQILPGYPNIKLWPDSAAALGLACGILTKLHDKTEKRSLRAGSGFILQPLHLTRIYVVSPSNQLGISPLPVQKAFIELLRHTYSIRLPSVIHQPSHLRDCGQILSKVKMRVLNRPDDLQLLPRLVRLIEEDVLSN